jgi:ribosomal protein S18 acetylase RimI-like enzyme
MSAKVIIKNTYSEELDDYLKSKNIFNYDEFFNTLYFKDEENSDHVHKYTIISKITKEICCYLDFQDVWRIEKDYFDYVFRQNYLDISFKVNDYLFKQLQPYDGLIYILTIETHHRYTRLGLANWLFKHLIKEFDNHFMMLQISPFGDVDDIILEKFYNKYGFNFCDKLEKEIKEENNKKQFMFRM